MVKKIIFLIILGLFFKIALASAPIYFFSTHKQEQRFQTLTTNLRCLVCQNENLADSNAPLAADLRKQIANLIVSGQSDSQILHYLVTRYGDFILYRPPFNITTLLLWLAPFFLCAFGLLALCLRIVYLRRVNQKLDLSPEQRQLAEKMLQE